jgi:repressor LexA
MKPLKRKDCSILDFIEEFWNKHMHSPTYDEIGASVELAKSGVSRHLRKLQKRGYLGLGDKVSRTITLYRTSNGRPFKLNVRFIPLMGTITAGEPIPFLDSTEPLDWIPVARDAFSDVRDVFALRVRGDSMIDALVNDGDTIFLKSAQSARDGDSVAVRILTDPTNPQTTLKEFYRRGKKIVLRPRNPMLKEKSYPANQIEIMGILISTQSDRRNKLVN